MIGEYSEDSVLESNVEEVAKDIMIFMLGHFSVM